MPNHHPKPAPEPQDDTPKSVPMPPESSEDSGVDPDESVETPLPTMFKYSPQGTVAYLNFCLHTDSEALGWIDAFREDGRPHMAEHFVEAYGSIVRDIEEAFEVSPGITPRQLMQRVADLTCWLSSPCSEIGGEARLSASGEDRRSAWEAAHVVVFNLLGGTTYAPGEEDDLSTDPVQDIELTVPASRARHEALLEALRLAHRALQHSAEALSSFTYENAMADVAQPYAETYVATLANLAELVRQRPDVTPEDLVRIMETRCEMPQESLGETSRRIEPGAHPCAWQFGEKEARRDVLTLLTNMLQPVPTALDSSEHEHRRGFTHAPEEIVRLVEEGFRTAPEVRSLLTDMYEDESLRHMQQSFETAYALAVNDLRTAFREDPNLTPDGLFRRLWASQRQFGSGVLAEDREIALCTHRVQQSYALIHGYQAAMTVLTRLVPIDRP